MKTKGVEPFRRLPGTDNQNPDKRHPKRSCYIGSFPNVSPEKEDNKGDRKAGCYGWREVHRLYQRTEIRGEEVRGRRSEERGKRKEERGKRKEERGKRKEERGKREEERGERREERGERREERGERREDRGQRTEDRGQSPTIYRIFAAGGERFGEPSVRPDIFLLKRVRLDDSLQNARRKLLRRMAMFGITQ